MSEVTEGASERVLADRSVEYFRGAGGVRVDGRRVAVILAMLSTVVLAVLIIVLSVFAYRDNSRITRLKAQGVPVTVTVTSCLGMASGTGITEAGFRCRGSFTLSGHRFNEVIGGSGILLSPGQTVSAVVAPGDPATLSEARSVMTSKSSWKAYTTPAILLVPLAASLFAWARLRRRLAQSRDVAIP